MGNEERAEKFGEGEKDEILKRGTGEKGKVGKWESEK